MKTISRFFMAAVAVASMVACAQEITEPTGNSTLALDEFGASSETATKVTIDANWMLSWEAGDNVDIYEGATKTVFAAQNAGETTTLKAADAEFARENGKTYYAVYPSAESIDGETVTINVAGDRTAVAGQYPSAPAVGVTSGETAMFKFRNVCGLISFVVEEGQNIASVVIFGGAEENIAGQIEVNANTAEYALVEGTGVKEIRLTPSDGDTFAAGRYYVAVLPQEFTSGLSVSLYAADGTRLRKNIKSFTLGRAVAIDVETGGIFKTEYTIKNADELVSFLAVAPNCAASTVATLANDIDLSGVTLPAVSTFAGTFDGNGKSLKNWTTDSPLFTKIVVGATVKGIVLDASCTLKMKETSSYEQSYVVGKNEGTVSGCTNNADVTYTLPEGAVLRKRTFGTIVCASTGVVSDCHNTGDITITIPELTYTASDADEDAYKRYQHQRVGGVIGTFKSTEGTNAVDGCTNSGDISYKFLGAAGNLRPFFAVGGVCALGCNENPTAEASATTNYGTMNKCENSGAVSLLYNKINTSNYANVGGVVGYIEGSLTGCINQADGAVSFTTEKNTEYLASAPGIGGVVGTLMLGNISSCENKAPVSMCGTSTNAATSRGAYVGGFHATSVGGVVGKAGTFAENTNYKITDSKNSGAVSVEVYGSYVHVGGIVGWTSMPVVGSDTDKLQNSGTVTVVKAAVGNVYAGGVIGRSKSTYDKLYNTSTASVTVNMDDSVGKQVYVAGIAGYMEKKAAATFKQGINNAKINVSGCSSTSGSSSYVGGCVGGSQATSVNSNGTEWVKCNSNYGDISVNCPVHQYVGGVVAQAGNGSTTSKTTQFQKCKNRGNITVTSPASGSYIGGVFGHVTRGALGDANNCGVADDPVVIMVTGADSGTYVGGYIGEKENNHGTGIPVEKPDEGLWTMKLSGFGMYASISAPGATAGMIAGHLEFTGESSSNIVMLGGTDASRPKIWKNCKLNDKVVGDLASSEITESDFFAKVTPTANSKVNGPDDTSMSNRYMFFAANGTESVSYKDGLQNY